ncbi:PAS domain S-box protein [Abditibacterium utsteinense]|nr:PAS domain S-box protein [Abditibacterium utsteinense]
MSKSSFVRRLLRFAWAVTLPLAAWSFAACGRRIFARSGEAQRAISLEVPSDEVGRYRAFLAQSTQAIWCFEFVPPLNINQSEDEIIDQGYERGFLSECNDIFAHGCGFESAAPMIGMRLSDWLPREDPTNLARFRAFIRSSFRLNGAESVETTRDGEKHEFLNDLIGIVEDGQLKRVWGTQHEVTAQKAAISELKASEARFRALFDTAPVAISISREGVLMYVNRASVELLGCQNPDQMIGHAVSEFVAPTDRETMQERIAARASGSSMPLVYDALALRGDGKTLPLRVEVTPLELPDGAATLGFAFDLSAERAVEAQRAEALAKERRTALYAARLQQITADLAASLTGEAVAELIVSRGIAALDASAGALSMPTQSERGPELEIIVGRGYPSHLTRNFKRLPVAENSPLPAVRVLVEGRPVWIENAAQAQRDFPVFSQTLRDFEDQSVCLLPLEFEDQILGVLCLNFAPPRPFDAEIRAFLLTLAGQCAQALERVRLADEAQNAARLQRESLALLNTLLETAPVGFAFFDLQGRYVLVNEALAAMNCLPVEEHLGQKPRDILLSTGARIAEAIDLVMESGKPSGEIEIVSSGNNCGQEICHSIAAFYPVRAGENEILGVGSVVIDISARMSAERDRVQLLGELEMERARFEAILHQMPSAVIIAEAPSGRLVLDNPQAEAVLGQHYATAQSIAGYARYRGFHFDGREFQAHEWPLARALQKGEIVRGEEIMLRRDDQSTAVVRLNAAPIRDRDGHITAAVAIFDDVTQRAREGAAQRFLAEAGSALISTLDERASYQQLANLCVPNVTDWCIVAVPGNDGLLSQVAIACVNEDKKAVIEKFQSELAADPQLPWDVGGALRGRRAMLYPQHTIDWLLEMNTGAAYRRFIEQIGAKSAIVTPLAARGRVLGTMIWISAESGRDYDDDDLQLADEIARRAGLSAANARLYFEAQTARHEAENANRAKDEFLAVVSHELRTPLTPILGWLELLRAPNAGEEIRTQAYSVIERNARAQAQLINDILDVSRITTGKLRFEFKPIALHELIESVAISLRPGATEKDIDFQLQIEDVGLARADANRIQQVVWNLLQNAFKFTPKNGSVRVALQKSGGRAILEVQDSGQGIETAFLPHVFDRFRQADSSSTRRAGGLGLGLAIVAHIVEGHGGEVNARSEGPGQGSTFRVELPLLMEELEPDSSLAPAPFPLPEGEIKWENSLLQNIKILVVDDEPDTRQMLQMLLKTCGANVTLAVSASDALQFLGASTPDILVSDIGMALTDGYELRREITRLGHALPSIALSAYTAPSDVQKALDAGFDAHLAKPVDAEKLIFLIAQLARATKNQA